MELECSETNTAVKCFGMLIKTDMSQRSTRVLENNYKYYKAEALDAEVSQ